MSTPQLGRMVERQIPDKGGIQVPPDIDDRRQRAMARIRGFAPERNECWEFFRNNTYAFRTAENQLTQLATQPSIKFGGKPNHRVRMRRPIHMPIIRQEVAYATQRVPGYEVQPTNNDQQTQHAARIAEKVARYGYDKWRLKRATEKVVTMALVADMGYAWPYWDDQAGPSLGFDEETERELHQGEVAVRTFSSTQVGWEPGEDFEDSRWYIIVRAIPLEQVKELPGYIPGELSPDATTGGIHGRGRPSKNMVLVTEYLERPCQKYPKGRRLCIAGNRCVTRIADYPLRGPKGEILDEPVLHKLTVMTDPDSDQDLGLMRFLLDTVRTYQDAANKQAEWKNLAMIPQIFKKKGMNLQLTDEPGAVWDVSDVNQIKWRDVPQVPQVLSEMQDRAKGDLGFFSSQNDIPSQVEAARAIQALLERDNSARAGFIANLAEFHGRVMRHCLSLVAMHYTEGRLIQINGWQGSDSIQDFKGADLMDQVNVVVLPGSIAPRSRQEQEQKVMNFLQMQLIPPHIALAAMDRGDAEGLAQSYQLDIARANRIIQQIFEDPESVMAGDSIPVTTTDPMTGMQMQTMAPWWMPRKGIDNVAVWKGEIADAMKTERFDNAPEHIKAMFDLVWQGLLMHEQQEAMEAQMAMNAQAEQQGLGNAAQEQTKPMPSLPGISGPGGQVDPAAGQG